MAGSNLDRVAAEMGFKLIDISETFCLDGLKQKALDIINKHKKFDSINSLKSLLTNIKTNVDNKLKEYEELLLKKLSDTTNTIDDALFKDYYYYLFILKPTKLQVSKKLEFIEKQKNKKYNPNNGRKIIEDIEKLVKNLKFEFDPKEFEREINKALGILIEDGLFAYSIWLESEDKEPHKAMRIMSLLLLRYPSIKLIENSHDLRDGVLKEISISIEKTLLARQLLERMLVYARYRAKALQKGD